MGSMLNQRNAAAGGILAMALLVVGNFMYGQPPKFAASGPTVTSFFHDHHKTVLVGILLTGLAVPLYVWFVAYLALAIRGALGAAVALGGLLVAACASTGDALPATLAHAAKLADPSSASIRLLYELSAIAYSRLFWAGLAVAIPVALAATAGGLKAWVRWVAWAQAALFFLGGLSLKSGGFFSPTGGMALIGYLAFFVGTAAIAFALWQASPATASATAPASTPV
jgi:hypothetical protein